VIEVRETAEEPVVSKTARVAEEVVVRKDVTEHTETVRDTVRREEVEVEKDGGPSADRSRSGRSENSRLGSTG
jgi:stress response protein YsnF